MQHGCGGEAYNILPKVEITNNLSAPVHIDVGGTIYTTTLGTLTCYPNSRLCLMFDGTLPVVLDSLKQHYFIDRDGAMFRHILNYLRNGELMLPNDFKDLDLLLTEATFYGIGDLIRILSRMKYMREYRTPAPFMGLGPMCVSQSPPQPCMNQYHRYYESPPQNEPVPEPEPEFEPEPEPEPEPVLVPQPEPDCILVERDDSSPQPDYPNVGYEASIYDEPRSPIPRYEEEILNNPQLYEPSFIEPRIPEPRIPEPRFLEPIVPERSFPVQQHHQILCGFYETDDGIMEEISDHSDME